MAQRLKQEERQREDKRNRQKSEKKKDKQPEGGRLTVVSFLRRQF